VVASSHDDDDDDRLFFLLNAFVCGCELYLALKYSVYIDLRGRSLIVKEKERRTMRKILLTARRWDLIFDVLRSTIAKDHKKKQSKKKKTGERRKKRTTHTHEIFISSLLKHTEVIRRREVK
jgi:Na+/phosphate symporter